MEGQAVANLPQDDPDSADEEEEEPAPPADVAMADILPGAAVSCPERHMAWANNLAVIDSPAAISFACVTKHVGLHQRKDVPAVHHDTHILSGMLSRKLEQVPM